LPAVRLFAFIFPLSVSRREAKRESVPRRGSLSAAKVPLTGDTESLLTCPTRIIAGLVPGGVL
jgi:hypothetical protein